MPRFAVTKPEGIEEIDAAYIVVGRSGELQFLGEHIAGEPMGDHLITVFARGAWTRCDKAAPVP